jgi:hypothetical protein
MRKSKGLLSTALDVGETIAGVLPGAIKGIRSMFNLKEASFATPASFANVTNNITQLSPASEIRHPVLGNAGIRIHGSQPFSAIQSSVTTAPVTWTFFDSGTRGATTSDPFTIPVNPLDFGGPLGVQALLYDRYVFRQLKFVFTTQQTTNYLGLGTFCYEADANNDVVGSVGSGEGFVLARMVTPNVTFPWRIPKAELDVLYEGPELYYCGPTGVDPSSGAEERQKYQGLFKGFDASPPLVGVSPSAFLGVLDVEYVIDFYDPIPPITILGASSEEMDMHKEVRRFFQERNPPRKLVHRTQPCSGRLFEDFARFNARLSLPEAPPDPPAARPPDEPPSHVCPGKLCACRQ